jgi:hypothetical protein
MTRDVEFHASPAVSDADPYIEAVLNLWPPESDSDLGRSSLWRGALAITIAGIATIALLGVLILQIGHGALAAIWMAVGLPLVLLAAAAVRFSGGRLGLRAARLREPANPRVSPRFPELATQGLMVTPSTPTERRSR